MIIYNLWIESVSVCSLKLFTEGSYEMKSVLTMRLARFEALERRELLAGGGGGSGVVPVPVPSVTFTNRSVPVLNILPGATDQLVADFTLKGNGRANSKDYARPEEIIVIPAWGSEPLAWNTTFFTLRADLDGKAKNGCETVLSTASVNYETDIVDFLVYRPVWVRANKAMHFQITANFNSWLSGEPGDAQIGFEVAQVLFRDLRNNPVPDERVTYKGPDPKLHNLENQTLYISQKQMNPEGVIVAGQKGVNLLQFASWHSEGVVPGSMTFVASQGSLSNIQSFSLWVDKNWDGQMDDCLIAGVCPQDGKVVFDFSGTESFDGAQYEVRGDIADVLSADPVIQLALSKSITATVSETGKGLKGVRWNGDGAGQVQVWAWPEYATLYNILAQCPLVDIAKSANSPQDQIVVKGQSVTLLAIKVTSSFESADLGGFGFVISPIDGAAPVLANLKLFADGVDITSSVSFVFSTDGAKIEVTFNPRFTVLANSWNEFSLKGEIASSGPYSFNVRMSGIWVACIAKFGDWSAEGNKISVV